MAVLQVLLYIFLIVIIVALIILSYVFATFTLTGFLGAPYVGTPRSVVREMLNFIDFQPGETITDLGSGSGSILIVAVQEFGAAKAIGYEINPILVLITKFRIKWHGLEGKVEVRRANMFKADLEPTDVLGLYLLAGAMGRLAPRLLKFFPADTRIVSRGFQVPGLSARRKQQGAKSILYFYRVQDLLPGSFPQAQK